MFSTMKSLCLKLKNEIDKALESLRDIPFDILNNRHRCLQQNISTLKAKGIIIVSLGEYRKLALAELTLREAIKRGYGLSLPKKTEKPSRGTMSHRQEGSGLGQGRKRGRLSLVRC